MNPMTDLINALKEYLERPVILADQSAPKPDYPYIAIKEMINHIPSPESITTAENKQTSTSQPTKSLSITAYSKSFNDVSELITRTYDWFRFVGYRKLKELGYVVERMEPIMNRDSLIVDDYERRRGFDVILRFVHQIERDFDVIETVDYEIKGRDE